jgi:cytochrome c biogenesis protein CcmG/thiol:disulfide interchange protein DsbE
VEGCIEAKPGDRDPEAREEKGNEQAAASHRHAIGNRPGSAPSVTVSQVRLFGSRSGTTNRCLVHGNSVEDTTKPHGGDLGGFGRGSGWGVWLVRDSGASESEAAAPEVTLECFDGSSQQLSELQGRPVVLNFWASWCPACISEMPAFGEVHRRVGEQVEFIGINMQEVDLDAAEDLAEQTKVDYRLAHDRDGAIHRVFGGIGMPTTVFISSDGAVESVHAGALFEEDLTSIIESELLG